MSDSRTDAFGSLDEDRRVATRASYLDRTTTLSAAEAEAVAWSEEGYTTSGIAAMMGSTAGTIETYLRRVTARYGVEAFGATVGDRTGEEPLDPVTPAVLAEYSDEVLRQWATFATEHRSDVPSAAAEYATENLHRRASPDQQNGHEGRR